MTHVHRASHSRRAGAHPALYLDLQVAGDAKADLEEDLVSSACSNSPTGRFLRCEGTAQAYEPSARAFGTKPYSGEWWRCSTALCWPGRPQQPSLLL